MTSLYQSPRLGNDTQDFQAQGTWGSLATTLNDKGELVGTVNKADVSKDEVLAMIIAGKQPGEVSKEDIAELHAPAENPGGSPAP